ncbi:MAG: hypothetical protein HQL06_07380 [Nitrospirae bacterium]|nr:hypothetical protein [Nitrospirota bacterium]
MIRARESCLTDLIDYKWKASKDDLISEMERKFATKSDQAMYETEVKVAIGKIKMSELYQKAAR